MRYPVRSIFIVYFERIRMYVSAIDAKYNSIISSAVFSYDVIQTHMCRISVKEGARVNGRSCWDVNKQVYL